MACGCAADKQGLIMGGSSSRRRRGSSQRRGSGQRRSGQRQRRSGRKRKGGLSRRSNKKARLMRGGVSASLLGDQASNLMNYTSKLIGTPGVPSMPWNQPANSSYRHGNPYVV